MADNKPTKKKKPIYQISSLADLEPPTVKAQFEFDDHIEVIELKALGFTRWVSIGWEVPTPTPPIHHVDPDTKMPVSDYKDAGYIRAVAEAEQKRTFKRLLASLCVKVPGNSEDEQLAYLGTLDASRVRMLISTISQIAMAGEATLDARADAGFQST